MLTDAQARKTMYRLISDVATKDEMKKMDLDKLTIIELAELHDRLVDAYNAKLKAAK